MFETYVSSPVPSANPSYIMNNDQDFQKNDNTFDWIIVDHLQTLKAYTAYFQQEAASSGDSATYNKIIETAEEIDNVIIPTLHPLTVRMPVSHIDINLC